MATAGSAALPATTTVATLDAAAVVPMPAPVAAVSVPPLSVYANAIIGASAGTLEVLIDQPLVAIKNALQEGRAVSLNPAVLYRGVGVNASSIAPITAVQFAVNGYGKSVLSKNGTRELTDVDRLGVSALAGAMSALVSSPAELVMIQQQRTGLALGYTARTIVRDFSASTLYRGLMPTMMRESLFTCGYLGLGPVLQDIMVKKAPKLFEGKEMLATLFSSILAGQVAAVLSQPADTVKTRVQADLGGFGTNLADG